MLSGRPSAWDDEPDAGSQSQPHWSEEVDAGVNADRSLKGAGDSVPAGVSAQDAESEYYRVLDKAKVSVTIMTVVAALKVFFFFIRRSVWVLYARRLTGDHTGIAVVVGFGYFFAGVMEVALPWAADRLGFGLVMTCTVLAAACFTLMEALAPDFGVLATGYLLASVFEPAFSIGLAYLAKVLPHDNARNYSTCFQSCTLAAEICGPLGAGVIVWAGGFRACFFVSAGVGLWCVFLCLVFLCREYNLLEDEFSLYNIPLVDASKQGSARGSRSGSDQEDEDQSVPLMSGRRATSPVRRGDRSVSAEQDDGKDGAGDAVQDREEEFRFKLTRDQHFPICLDRSAESRERETRRKWYSLPPLTSWERFILGNTLLCCVVVAAGSAVLGTFYVPYMHDKFGVHILESTAELSLIALFGVAGALAAWALDARLARKMPAARHFFAGACIALHGVLFLTVYPIAPAYAFWLVAPLVGACQGATVMLLTFVLIGVQPARHSGKVFGVRRSLEVLLGMALAVTVAGLLWAHRSKESIWYTVAGFDLIGFFACFVVVCVRGCTGRDDFD